MTPKKSEITEKGILDGEIKKLMTAEAIKELGALNPTMQQFLLRFMDYSLMEHDKEHDKILSDQLKEELKEFLLDIYEQDNNEMCKNIAEIVQAQNKKMFQVFADQTRLIEKIAKDIGEIKLDIININKRLDNIEMAQAIEGRRIADIEKELKEKDKRFEELSAKVEALEPVLVKQLIYDMEMSKPQLDKLIKYSGLFWTVTRMLIAGAIGVLIVWFLHTKYWQQ